MCWFFFFFKQKTAYEMRISDWSSDVCSSDLLDRYFHESGGVVGAEPAHTRRKTGGQFVHFAAHCGGHTQRVRAGQQLHRKSGDRGAVVARAETVAGRSEADPGDIAQGHRGAVAIRAQDDALELLGRGEAALGADAGGELRTRRDRKRPRLNSSP